MLLIDTKFEEIKNKKGILNNGYCFVIVFLSPILAFSQNDTLVFRNADTMVGEIKSMDRGLLWIETDYSDKDFSIEWEKIRLINTMTSFFITLTDGAKYYGTIKSISDTTLSIFTGYKIVRGCAINDIVFLQQLKKSFWDRLHASIDIGFSTTKANNLRQLSSRSTIGYRTDKWLIDATFNSLLSRQDSVESIRRSDGKIDYRFVLPRRWYAIVSVSLAKNTEQKLDLRLNAQLGFGRFFIRTNSAYWGANLGVNRNVEQYSSETDDRYSWEGYVGTELNLYDIGDFSLLTNMKVYPGITTKERIRADFTVDTKYDLPYDLYIKIGMTFNYDNLPAEGATETDYIFQTGFGWEW